MKIFIDTWAWIALADKRDSDHEKATRLYTTSVLSSQNTLFTSEYVLSESLTHLRPRIGHASTLKWFDAVLSANRRGKIALIYAEQNTWNESLVLLRRTPDKPEISHTDFTTFVIMSRLGITEVFTGDHHFEQTNIGFHIIK